MPVSWVVTGGADQIDTSRRKRESEAGRKGAQHSESFSFRKGAVYKTQMRCIWFFGQAKRSPGERVGVHDRPARFDAHEHAAEMLGLCDGSLSTMSKYES